MKVLTQKHYQFDVVGPQSDLSPYRVLILPDDVRCNAALAKKVDAFVEAGGRLLTTGKSGQSPDGESLTLGCLPVSLVGESPHSPDYVVLQGDWAEGLPEMPLVTYERGLEVKADTGSDVLARVADPYFDRTWEHFCSHFHTPVEQVTDRPAIVCSERVACFCHPLFTSYHRHGYLMYREMLTRCLDRLLGRRLVESDLPSSARVTLMAQGERQVLHILHYIPEARTSRFQIVEDVIPLYDRRFSIALSHEPKKVYLAPQESALPFIFSNGRVEFTVPEIRGHQMVVFE
jgi:hypothetical protein